MGGTEDYMKLTFDIESNGLLDTCNTIWCLVAQDVTTKETYSYSDYDDDLPSLEEGLKLLQDAEVLIGHNIIGYDIPAIKIITGVDLIEKKCYDTFIMSQTLRYKRNHRHGLAGWGEALGNSKLHYDDWTKYTKEMLTYCIQDVHLNTEVYERLMKEFKSIHSINPLISKGLSVEHEVAKFNTIVREEGWNFDNKKAKANLKKLKDISNAIEKEIEPQLGETLIYIDKTPKTAKFKKDGTYNAVTCRILSDYFGYEYPQA